MNAEGAEISQTEPPFPCPCCGYLTRSEHDFGSFDICPICGWEDDNIQAADPSYAGGANVLSLTESRWNYATIGAADPEFRPERRVPLAGELPDIEILIADLGEIQSVAREINACARAKPLASGFRDMMADGWVWTDEAPEGKNSFDAINVLRPVWNYRTSLIVGEPDIRCKNYWDAGLKHFPDWIGFDRRRSLPTVLLAERIRSQRKPFSDWLEPKHESVSWAEYLEYLSREGCLGDES